jgi:son of sevenless-like protein
MQTFAYPQSATSISSPATKKRKIKALKGDPLVRMDPGIIAQHLATLEHRLFLKVKAQECLNWAKVQNGRTVANLQAFTMTHERIANWVKSSVLNENGLGKRADTVDFWIKVAEKCRALNNFASMSAIVAGLASTVIARLHLTWAHVGRVNHLDTLTKLAEPASNFSTWRTLLASTEGPCIPFIGMYLSDIVHVNDQLPDTIPGPGGLAFICFQKRMKWAEAVNSIVRHQGKPYFLAEVHHP